MVGMPIEPELFPDGSGRWVIHVDKDGHAACGKQNIVMRTNAPEAANCPYCLAIVAPNVNQPALGVGVSFKSDGRVCSFLSSDGWRGVRSAVLYAYLRIGPHHRCVEVGCQRGQNALTIAQVLQPAPLVLIDPWEDDASKAATGEVYLAEDFAEAKSALTFWPKTEFLREKSYTGLRRLANDSCGFVYIDGNHSPSVCTDDIRQALRITRVGGVVGGHDYGLEPMLCGSDTGHGDVAAAVHNVFEEYYVDAMNGDWWVTVTPALKAVAGEA